MALTTFLCPRCGLRSKADLRPLGRYPWPPHYVCPNCDREEDLSGKLDEKEPPEPPQDDSPRPQRQLRLIKDDYEAQSG